MYGCEYLLTWNCRHIANAELHRAIRRVIEEHGYSVPELCMPEELIGDELLNGKMKLSKKCAAPGTLTPRNSIMISHACSKT